MTKLEQWNDAFFTLMYQEIFMQRDNQKINEEVDLILNLSKTDKPITIADFCCGVGDILSGLEKRGHTTYGVEYSLDYVNKAKKVYEQKNVYQGDALTLNFNKKFDLIINWNSSFGYFSDIE